MEAACKLARDYWHRTYDAADRAEDAEQRAAVEVRRKLETLFQVAPGQAPKLFEEGSWFGHAARTDDELAWAEQRLRDLRFEMRLEDRTKSYVRQEPDLIVYADPRFLNRIDLSVYATRQAERAGTKRTKARYVGQFYLMDSWKRDVSAKFESRFSNVARRRASKTTVSTELYLESPEHEL